MDNNLFTRIRSAIPAGTATLLKGPDGSTITYDEMLEASARIANVLTGLGVSPGDRVAVQVEKSPQALFTYLACLRSGAVYLPLNTAYTGAELGYFLSDSEPTVVVCDPAARERTGKICREASVPHLETLGADGEGSLSAKAAAAGAAFGDVPRAAGDMAAILYTSGTTGRSKGAMITHANLSSNALTLRDDWRFTGDDVLLHALPLFHTHGLFVATNVILLAGASMIFLPRFDADGMICHLPDATTMMGVPTHYTRLLARDDFTSGLVAHMRLFTSGSAPLSAQTHDRFRERTGHAILERYGMTETNMIASNPYDGARRAGTVGFPLPGIEVRITDRETAAPLPDGNVGVIEVRGPNVFSGYWRMPEKTRQEFRKDGFFITGDLGMFDEQGYLSLVGRDKDLIISGGFNVYPAEIENALDALDGIAESAVIGVPHPDFGEAVTAVVAATQPTRGAQGAEPGQDAIRQPLKNVLANYKVPKRVVFVDRLPRNTMGKIEKKDLREQFRDLYGGG